jgi:hypothetical protein
MMNPLTWPIAYPIAFWGIAIGLSLYYGIRGGIIQVHIVGDENVSRINNKLKPWEKWERNIVHCIQDVIYNFVGGLSGFAALYVECKIFIGIKDLSNISTGTALVIVFLSIFSVVGISGVMPPILLHGKLFSGRQ